MIRYGIFDIDFQRCRIINNFPLYVEGQLWSWKVHHVIDPAH